MFAKWKNNDDNRIPQTLLLSFFTILGAMGTQRDEDKPCPSAVTDCRRCGVATWKVDRVPGQAVPLCCRMKGKSLPGRRYPGSR